MQRVHRFTQVCALVSACGVTACGGTTNSSEADDATDAAGGSSSSSAAGDSGGGASDSESTAATSSGSGMTDSGGASGGTSSSAGGSSGSAGGGGSAGSSGSAGGGGSASTGTTGAAGNAGNSGWVPEDQTPGAFACGEAEVSAPLVRLTNVEYDNTIFDLLGLETLDAYGGVRPSAVLADDPPDSITELGWEVYRTVAAAIAAQVMEGPLATNFVACDPGAAGCLSDTIITFGRRAFRRPLTQDELADYEGLLPEDPADLSQATAETILSAMLASPSFVWRLEQGGLSEPELSSHELASRLSYFLWGGPPDAALSAAADAGELETEEQIAAQALRMLDDPRLLRSFAEFHRGYLRMSEGSYWGATEHDTQMYPFYSPEVNQAALAELAAFLDDVVASEGSFQDLFLSNIGFVNQDTAPLYGLAPDNFGNDLVRVELDPIQRPGLLTRVAFLSSFSAYASTSPVLRGIFVTNQILDLMPSASSGEIPVLVPPGEFSTNRERVTAQTSPAACAACHAVYIDPIGFALETYDAVGAWQTIDPLGGPIDPVADVFFGDEIVTVQNSLELMQKLADSTFAHRTYADTAVAYAFSRLPNAHDACLADVLAASIAEGISLPGLWLELARSDEFRVRGALED